MSVSPCPVDFTSLPDGRYDPDTIRAYKDARRAFGQDFGRAVSLAFGSVAPSDLADPYPDWETMGRAAGAARAGFAPFLVSNVEHAHPLWSDAENWTFRAHHDAIHELSGHPAFTFEGETAVVVSTVRALVRYNLTSHGAACLVSEIIGQAQAFGQTGTFPRTEDGLQRVARLCPDTVRSVTRWLFLCGAW